MMTLMTACLAAVSAAALATEPPRCGLTYDARAHAIVLEHRGTSVSVDTRVEADGLHVIVDFARPSEVCLGPSLAAVAPFARWQQVGNRLTVVFAAPYELIVDDDPEREEARLINVALGDAPGSAIALAPRPAPAPSVAPALPALPTAGPTERPLAPVPLPEPPLPPVTAASEPPPVAMTVAGRLPVAAPVALPVAPPLPPPPVVAPAPETFGAIAAATEEAPPLRLEVPALPAVPRGTSGPVSLGVTPRLGVGGYTETYLPGDVAVQSAGIAMPGVRLEGLGQLGWGPTWLQGAWDGAFQLDFAMVAFRDTLLPLSTHTRQTWRAELSATRRFTLGDWRLGAGLGYGLRSESTLHSAVAPAPSYAFAGGRLLHGPLLALGGGWAPARATGNFWLDGWSAQIDAGVQPVVFSHLDAGVPALPWLVGTQVALSLERRVAAWTVSVGFQRRGLDGAAYNEVFQGPFLAVR